MKWAKVSKLSAYGRAESHLVQPSALGAIVTVSGAVLAICLAASEIGRYLWPEKLSTMVVDTHRGQHMRIHLNISTPMLPCGLVSLDVVDISGEHGDDTTMSLAHNGEIHKMRTDSQGRHLGYKEFIPAKPAWQTHFMLRPMRDEPADLLNKAIDDKEGCNIWGWLDVQRVAGNFHLGVHASSYFMLKSTQDALAKALQEQVAHQDGMMHNIELPADNAKLNMTHTIHSVHFGPHFPGQVNPLDGYTRRVDEETGVFNYFIKVVPTVYRKSRGSAIFANQYSVTEYFKQVHQHEAQMPAIYFRYEMSPIRVELDASSGQSFLQLLVKLAACIGGVFACTSFAAGVLPIK